MATHEATIHPFPAQGRTLLTITSEEISRYAEISALVNELEMQQRALRAQLLELHKYGAQQENGSPYLLNFVDQERRTVDWKTHALELAAKVYGIEKAAEWKRDVEAATPAQQITQVRVKPNPIFAAGLKKPAASVRMAPPPEPDREAVCFGN
jgi:hypothetical protein